MNDELLTRKELIEKLKLSRSTVHRWEKEGMPHFKVGDHVRYNYDAVLAWMKERTQNK